MSFWRRKPLSVLMDEDHPHTLKRTLGPLNLISLGIGAVIGAGLFSITGIAAAQHAGPAIILSFIIAAVGCTFAGLCYAELAAMIPVAGSAYTYAYMAMGELLAWIIGWNLILEYAIGSATVAVSWSAYLVSFLQDFGIQLPTLWVSSPWNTPEGVFNVPAFLIVVVISMLLITGVNESAFVNNIFVAIKLSVVALFIGVGVFYIQWDNYFPFIPENTGTFGSFGWSGILRAAGLIFFAYIGFDMVSTASQEVKNPQRNVPIGILGTLVICTTIYVLFSAVMVGLVPYLQLDVAAPVAVAIEQTPFHWIQSLVKVAILAGFSSVILMMLYGQSRIFYSMANDRFLPDMFARIHPRFRTPWICNLVLMVFVGLWAALVPLSVVGNMASIGTLLAFVIVCAGTLILRYTHPEQERPFKVPFFPWIPILGIIWCSILMFSLDSLTWLRLSIWLLAGFFIYLFYSRKRLLMND